jgi:hypothetical protein
VNVTTLDACAHDGEEMDTPPAVYPAPLVSLPVDHVAPDPAYCVTAAVDDCAGVTELPNSATLKESVDGFAAFVPMTYM